MESFILSGKISKKVCNSIINSYEENFNSANFDKDRGYWRLNDRNLDKEVITQFQKELFKVENKYREKYPHINQCTKWGLMSPYNIQKYEPGYAYNPIHIEDGGPKDNKYQRILAFTTYLNDVKIGGETEFINQDIKIKPKQGNTIIWPAGWTHPHRGIPAPNETKYIITGWFSYHFKAKKL